MYTVLFYDIKVNDELHRAVDKWDQFNRANALPSIALEVRVVQPKKKQI